MSRIFLFGILITSCLFCSITANAERIRLQQEAKDDVEGISIAIQWPDLFDELSNSSFTITPGVSAGTLEADEPLTFNDRTRIYPVYAFLNFSTDYIITPFFEFGIDAGDILVNEIFETEEETRGYNIDTYYSVGLEIKLHKTTHVSFFYKAYQLAYQDVDETERHTVYPEVVGASLSLNF